MNGSWVTERLELATRQPDNPVPSWLAQYHPPFPLPDFYRYRSLLNPLPEGSFLLGICEDGIPLLVDFHYKVPACILMVSDHPAAVMAFQTLVHANLRSMLSLPAGREEIVEINFGQDPVRTIHSSRGLARASGSPEQMASMLDSIIGDMQDRMLHGTTGPRRLLILRGLSDSLLSHDSWLVDQLTSITRFGDRVGIKIIADYYVEPAGILDDRFISGFDTLILGELRQTILWNYFTPNNRPGRVRPSAPFTLVSAGRDIPFWIPRIDS